MAFKVTYLLKEAGQNLVRNWGQSIASILTVILSMAVLGASFLVGYAVDNATQRWEGGIEFVVWMNPDATPEQDASIAQALDESPEIESSNYVDQQEAFEEFQDLFRDEPALLEAITPEDLPPSYRVVPVDPDADSIEALAATFEGRPGVRSVVSSQEAIKEIQKVSDRIRFVLLCVSIALVVVAVILMFITISVAISARSNEVEVMKLVGATNWFIRVPFMLEGLVHGVIGGGLAVLALRFFDTYVIDSFNSASNLKLLAGFSTDSTQLFNVSAGVFIGGAVVGMLGAGFAVSRHLDV